MAGAVRIAVNRRRLDDAGQWVDGEPTFLTASIWGDQARHVAQSLLRGQRVIVDGQLVTRTWTSEGAKRTALEVVVDEIGPSLRWAAASIRKAGLAPDMPDGIDDGFDGEPDFRPGD